MAEIILNGVSKVYENGARAVNDVNLTIPEKQFAVLVGPSGCGKSTLLRMIAGLEDISEGTISIDGKVMNKVPAKDRDIAMVFQDYALYPHMTVRENLLFGLKLRKIDKKDIDRRIDEAASILELGTYMDRKPKALSGGQRQRVALGRAIVRKPKVFLFDEPLSNLDAKLRGQMRVELVKLHRQLQATMVYVTHDQVEALTMGDQIIVLRSGVMQQVADPINLYKQPSNEFVASFIGSPAINFFPVDINEKEGKLKTKIGSLNLTVPPELMEKLKGHKGKKLTMGLRPEDINISDTKPEGFLAVVDNVEPLGSETIVYMKYEELEFVAKLHPDEPVKVGDKLRVYFRLRKARYFDPETSLSVL